MFSWKGADRTQRTLALGQLFDREYQLVVRWSLLIQRINSDC